MIADTGRLPNRLGSPLCSRNEPDVGPFPVREPRVPVRWKVIPVVQAAQGENSGGSGVTKVVRCWWRYVVAVGI